MHTEKEESTVNSRQSTVLAPEVKSLVQPQVFTRRGTRPVDCRLSTVDFPTCALFDIDGTLFDTERLWAEALSLVFEDLGCRQSPRRLTELTYGLAWPDADAALRGAFPEVLAGLSMHALGHRLCCRFDELFALAPPVIEPAVALLRALRQAGVLCGYVSGSPRRTIARNLRLCGLEGLLDVER